MYDRKKIRSAQNVTDVSFFIVVVIAYTIAILVREVLHETKELKRERAKHAFKQEGK